MGIADDAFGRLEAAELHALSAAAAPPRYARPYNGPKAAQAR